MGKRAVQMSSGKRQDLTPNPHGMNRRHVPPPDGHPMQADLKLRQHEVQVVAGPGDGLAAAWTDDSRMDGILGWTCGFAVSSDGGTSWTDTHFYKNPGFAVSGNPTIAAGRHGAVFAVAMSVAPDYASGVLEFSSSTDAGCSWSDWALIVAKHDGIPDRPRLLITADGMLHLVFAHVERQRQGMTVLCSTVQICSSGDSGRSWTQPLTVSTRIDRSRWFISGYQGPAVVEHPNGQLRCSWADYYGNAMWIASATAEGALLGRPLRLPLKRLPGTNLFSWLLGATFGTPATEMAIDASGQRLVVAVYEAHAMAPVLLLGSDDGGASWQRRGQLARRGTNACISFDPAGRLHLMWTEMRGRRVDIRYSTSADGGRSMSGAVSLAGQGAEILLPRSQEAHDECALALGSYQSLVVSPQGRINAFWIDLRAGLSRPSLYQSTWQD
jgi:hypothetical protein